MSVWLSGLVAAGMIALLELDAAAVGPFLLSRPFIVAPLVGWAFGDPWDGAVLGAVFEAVTLGALPLGGCLSCSATVAAGVAAWLVAGPFALATEAAFLAGLAAGWAHALVEQTLRRFRTARVHRVERALAAGREPYLGAEIVGTLVGQAAATFVLTLVALVVAGPAWRGLWVHLPGCLRAGARTSYVAAAWIAAGSLVASLLERP